MNLEKNSHSINSACIVALHSSASSSKQWKQLSADMEYRYDVLACELPGYQGSDYERCHSKTGMSAVADPILEDIQKIGQPVHLVGHSFGGGVALKIALTRPDLVKSLTLYEPASFHVMNNDDHQDRKSYAEFKQIAQILSSATTAGRPDHGMKAFVDFWNGKNAWEHLSPAAQNNLAKTADLVIADFSNLFSETWGLESLGRLNIPTMMLLGMESPAIAQRTAIQIAGHIPNANFAMLPKLGHMAPVFNSQRVNPHIYQHITQVEKTAYQYNRYQADAA
jgi:pimeloyl-ACP methyl ester carboxylesterase